MTITRKLTVHAVAVALAGVAAVPLSVVGGAGVAAAHVTPTYCPIPTSTGPYPPGQCYLVVDRGSYYRHQQVHFRSGNNFQPGEKVTITLTCAGGYTRTRDNGGKNAKKSVDADGVLTGHFKLDKSTPYGTCTITAVGQSSGSKVSASFQVIPKPHKTKKPKHH